MLMRLTKGTKKALSLALSTALVLTGANVGTLKADAADKDGVELTLKGETLNKKEATVKADGKVEVTTTFANAATAGALAGANFGETTTTVENVTEDFDLKIVSVKVGDKDVLSKKAVYGEYADSKNIATTSVGDFEKSMPMGSVRNASEAWQHCAASLPGDICRSFRAMMFLGFG